MALGVTVFDSSHLFTHEGPPTSGWARVVEEEPGCGGTDGAPVLQGHRWGRGDQRCGQGHGGGRCGSGISHSEQTERSGARVRRGAAGGSARDRLQVWEPHSSDLLGSRKWAGDSAPGQLGPFVQLQALYFSGAVCFPLQAKLQFLPQAIMPCLGTSRSLFCVAE